MAGSCRSWRSSARGMTFWFIVSGRLRLGALLYTRLPWLCLSWDKTAVQLAGMGARLRQVLTRPQRVRWLNRGLALLLAGCAVGMLA